MKFVDQVQIKVKAGDGGNGCIAFRRERFIPFGGPSGGDGGRGGSVIFVAEEGRTSLLDLAHLPVLKAHRGEHGRGKDQYGKAGADLLVKVPIGTQVFLADTGEQIADLQTHEQKAIVAQGGTGGRGNIHFSSPFDRAPRRAEPGTEGEERVLRLELKVLADVGLLGFPNVGKSTLVATMSRARPKIADYPFTTLRPHLGVVRIGGRASTATFVMADIPGLIPGASEGRGIGMRFLKHVERCRALLHLIAPPTDELREQGREPLADYDAIMHELAQFAPELAVRPQIVAMSKGDIPETREAYEIVKRAFAKRKIPLRLVSAATGEGLEQLARDVYHLVKGRHASDDDAEAEPRDHADQLGAVAPPVAALAQAAVSPTPKRPRPVYPPRRQRHQAPTGKAKPKARPKPPPRKPDLADVQAKAKAKAKKKHKPSKPKPRANTSKSKPRTRR